MRGLFLDQFLNASGRLSGSFDNIKCSLEWCALSAKCSLKRCVGSTKRSLIGVRFVEGVTIFRTEFGVLVAHKVAFLIEGLPRIEQCFCGRDAIGTESGLRLLKCGLYIRFSTLRRTVTSGQWTWVVRLGEFRFEGGVEGEAAPEVFEEGSGFGGGAGGGAEEYFAAAAGGES